MASTRAHEDLRYSSTPCGTKFLSPWDVAIETEIERVPRVGLSSPHIPSSKLSTSGFERERQSVTWLRSCIVSATATYRVAGCRSTSCIRSAQSLSPRSFRSKHPLAMRFEASSSPRRQLEIRMSGLDSKRPCTFTVRSALSAAVRHAFIERIERQALHAAPVKPAFGEAVKSKRRNNVSPRGSPVVT